MSLSPVNVALCFFQVKAVANRNADCERFDQPEIRTLDIQIQ